MESIKSSNFYNIYFEYFYLSVYKLVQLRKEKNSLVHESELWAMIKEVSSGMKFLQEKKISHGCLDSFSIFFDDEYLMYRIYDQ